MNPSGRCPWYKSEAIWNSLIIWIAMILLLAFLIAAGVV